MKILIIEDDAHIARYVAGGLRQEGHTVEVCDDGDAGFHELVESAPDCAIVDINLPGRDGLSLITEARGRGVSTPILVLSARSSVDDRVDALRRGADDYLVKPFSLVELSARVDAIARRAARADAGPRSLEYADLVLDLDRRVASRAGEIIELRAKEYQLLEVFLRNVGRVLTRGSLLERVWGYSFDPQTNVVDVLVHRLRKKIDAEHPATLLHTVRGVGYVLEAR